MEETLKSDQKIFRDEIKADQLLFREELKEFKNELKADQKNLKHEMKVSQEENNNGLLIKLFSIVTTAGTFAVGLGIAGANWFGFEIYNRNFSPKVRN